jgi:HPt (histidine-containing phosphotransfer) domain-containing protein
MFFGKEPLNSDGSREKSVTYDRNRLDDVCNGSEDLRRRILTEYMKTSPVLMSQLTASVAANDLAEIERVAHSLKGSSRTVGAFALADLCEAIEHDKTLNGVIAVEASEELERLSREIENHLGIM